MAEAKPKTTSTVSSALPKEIFGLNVASHQLLHTVIRAYQAQGRAVSATTLKRGQVRGGGIKPHPQKGTGRARAGSIRSPLWRGGGVTFGPSGQENYRLRLPAKARRLAIKQALSLKAADKAVEIIETFKSDGKTKSASQLLKDTGSQSRVLLVVSLKDQLVSRATRNLPGLKVVQARYLNPFDILRADTILISKKSLGILKDWLISAKTGPPKTAAETR